jgi:hypothetical protein
MIPARILAACQLKALWILADCPSKAFGVKFDYAANPYFIHSADLYKEVVERITAHARGRGLSHEDMTTARLQVQDMLMAEVLDLANQNGIFNLVMPDTILVMDVHAS